MYYQRRQKNSHQPQRLVSGCPQVLLCYRYGLGLSENLCTSQGTVLAGRLDNSGATKRPRRLCAGNGINARPTKWSSCIRNRFHHVARVLVMDHISRTAASLQTQDATLGLFPNYGSSVIRCWVPTAIAPREIQADSITCVVYRPAASA